MKKNHVDRIVEGAGSQGQRTQQAMSRRDMFSKSKRKPLRDASAPLAVSTTGSTENLAPPPHTLVILFLRGGCDGLSILAPRTTQPSLGPDPFYVAQRQTPGGIDLSIPQPMTGTPGNGVQGLTDPSGADLPWMLSEGAAAALPMYQAGDLAFVHGVGFPVTNNGSHFYSQDFMEDGSDPTMSSPDGQGWAGRGMQAIPSAHTLRGMGIGKLLQRTLFGAPGTAAIPDPTNYDLNGLANSKDLRKLGIEWTHLFADDLLKNAAADSLETVDKLDNPLIFTKPSTASYPSSPLGDRMKRVQQMIQASADTGIDLQLDTVMLDYGDWDNHNELGATPDDPANPSMEGMHNRMKDVFESMQAFYTDLKAHAPGANYTFVFMTEFGRRITANGSNGVDHGRGSLMAVMGSSGVNGGDVYTMLPNVPPMDGTVRGWNGLQAHSVLQGGTTPSYNLAVSVDYRRILGEVLEHRLHLTQAQVRGVFPGYDYALTADKMPIGVVY